MNEYVYSPPPERVLLVQILVSILASACGALVILLLGGRPEEMWYLVSIPAVGVVLAFVERQKRAVTVNGIRIKVGADVVYFDEVDDRLCSGHWSRDVYASPDASVTVSFADFSGDERKEIAQRVADARSTT